MTTQDAGWVLAVVLVLKGGVTEADEVFRRLQYRPAPTTPLEAYKLIELTLQEVQHG